MISILICNLVFSILTFLLIVMTKLDNVAIRKKYEDMMNDVEKVKGRLMREKEELLKRLRG